MAASAEIVREDYVPATSTWKSGPVLGNRTLRQGAEILDVLGIPTEPLGNEINAPTVGSQ